MYIRTLLSSSMYSTWSDTRSEAHLRQCEEHQQDCVMYKLAGSGVCNYLHMDFSACVSCSARNRGTRLPALDDVEGGTHTTTRIYRSCSTNTNCVNGCDCLDGMLTSCRICDSIQCKRCVTGGVGLMCYDCIDKLIMEDPDIDLDKLDIVGSTKGVESIPPAVIPVEMTVDVLNVRLSLMWFRLIRT